MIPIVLAVVLATETLPQVAYKQTCVEKVRKDGPPYTECTIHAPDWAPDVQYPGVVREGKEDKP